MILRKVWFSSKRSKLRNESFPWKCYFLISLRLWLLDIQDYSEGNINILGSDSIAHCGNGIPMDNYLILNDSRKKVSSIYKHKNIFNVTPMPISCVVYRDSPSCKKHSYKTASNNNILQSASSCRNIENASSSSSNNKYPKYEYKKQQHQQVSKI